MAIGDNVEQEDGHTSNLRKEPLQPSTSANDVHPSAAVAALHREGCPCSPPRGGLRPPARGSRSPAVAAACSRVEDGHTSISSKEALPPSTYTKGRRVSSRVLQVDCFVGRCLPTHCISRMSEWYFCTCAASLSRNFSIWACKVSISSISNVSSP